MYIYDTYFTPIGVTCQIFVNINYSFHNAIFELARFVFT